MLVAFFLSCHKMIAHALLKCPSTYVELQTAVARASPENLLDRLFLHVIFDTIISTTRVDLDNSSSQLVHECTVMIRLSNPTVPRRLSVVRDCFHRFKHTRAFWALIRLVAMSRRFEMSNDAVFGIIILAKTVVSLNRTACNYPYPQPNLGQTYLLITVER